MSGYFMTFMIAYIRDFVMDYAFFGESFETSVPWSKVYPLCKAVEKRIKDDCQKLGVRGKPMIAYRVTQVYDSGAAVYIYFGFDYSGIKDPLHAYEMIEENARVEILKNGGSISHHHGMENLKSILKLISFCVGVGKLRKQFMKDSIGENGIKVLRGLKEKIDPQNIFAANNHI